MGNFVDNPIKQVIREKWCKLILHHLNRDLNLKLTYLGLPGIEALDVKSWIDYLHYIIAIDCGDYNPNNYNFEKAKFELEKLNLFLGKLERTEKISGYSLFLGFIEEVILNGNDKNGKVFSQSRTVQIYNLDFCNSLTSPLKTIDLNGNVNVYFKNQVIRRLLLIQNDECKFNNPEKFIMFITVHLNIWEKEVKSYFSGKNDSKFEEYKHSIKNLRKFEKKARILRYYFIDILSHHFTTCEFIPEFFPTIIYNGFGNNTLLCFTIAGTNFKNASATAPMNQKLEDLINQKFLSANSSEIFNDEGGINETVVEIDPLNHLFNFKSYMELWKM